MAEQFNFVVKTELFFGNSRENEVGDILKNYNFHRVVIFIGQGSVKKSGLLDRVINSLKSSDIEYMLLEGIRPNPTVDFIYNHLYEVKEYKPDCLLAIGGGSVIDTAKLMAVAYYYEGDCFDFNLHKAKPKQGLPLGVILTISASGSEMSTSCVIQDDEKQYKGGFNSEICRPLFAIENPELTYTVSKIQTAYGIVDILMHTIERYFGQSGEIELADGIAEGLMREVLKAGEVVMEDPTNYNARKVLMVASSLSHSDHTSVVKKFHMPLHQLEHVISAVYPDVAHAAGLALIWSKWAEVYLDAELDKFDKFARNVFHSLEKDKRNNALYGIRSLQQYFEKIGMPKTFKDLGITDPNIDLLVSLFTRGGTRSIDHPSLPLDGNVAHKIYEKCI